MESETCTVITGARQGLGKAFAEECALRGRALVLAALPDTGLRELARWIERVHGVRVHALAVDLTSDDGPPRLPPPPPCATRRAPGLTVPSLAAFFPMPWLPVYSSSKSFVLAFSLALREELRGTGVSVSVVCPNGIRTNRGARELIARQGLAG